MRNLSLWVRISGKSQYIYIIHIHIQILIYIITLYKNQHYRNYIELNSELIIFEFCNLHVFGSLHINCIHISQIIRLYRLYQLHSIGFDTNQSNFCIYLLQAPSIFSYCVKTRFEVEDDCTCFSFRNLFVQIISYLQVRKSGYITEQISVR